MANIMLEKTLSGLSSFDDSGRHALQAWQLGDVIEVKATKPRNGGNHRRFFKLLQLCAENMRDSRTVEQLLVLLKIKTGRVNAVIDTDGTAHMIPQSIDFARMDEPEFRQFYHDASVVICRDYLDVDQATLEQHVNLL